MGLYFIHIKDLKFKPIQCVSDLNLYNQIINNITFSTCVILIYIKLWI